MYHHTPLICSADPSCLTIHEASAYVYQVRKRVAGAGDPATVQSVVNAAPGTWWLRCLNYVATMIYPLPEKGNDRKRKTMNRRVKRFTKRIDNSLGDGAPAGSDE